MRLLLLSLLLSLILPAAHAGEMELSILNYNIKGLPLPWLKHSPRYKRIGESLSEHFRIDGARPQILALQEAFHKKTAIVGDHLKYPQRIQGPKGKGVRISAGLETMTDLNVVAVNRIIFQRCASWDCLARKGVLHTRLSHPDLPFMIDLYNTHLQANPSSDPVTPERITRAIREEQALKMIQFVQETHQPDNLLILVGDFNFTYDSAVYGWFTSLLSLTSPVHECTYVQTCRGSNDPMDIWLGLIDHQFYRLPVGVKISTVNAALEPTYLNKLLHDPSNGKKLSDHEAVLIKYNLQW